MTSGQMFKTSMGGFNKKDVLDYINALNKEKDTKIKLLSSEVEELENIIARQKEMIASRDEQISGLLKDVEYAQAGAAEKYTEISQLMERMADNEQHLKDDIKRKENDFAEELERKEVELFEVRSEAKKSLQAKERLVEIKDREIQSIKDEMDKRIEELKSEYESIISGLRQEYGSKISGIREQHRLEIYDIKCKNERALTSAKEELAEIRASLESARIVEEKARERAEKMIAGAQQQCEEMKLRLKRDMELKRNESLKRIDAEVEFRRAEALEVCRRMANVVDAIKESKQSFARQCDEIVERLEKVNRI